MARWPAQYRRMMRWCDRVVATVDAGRLIDEHDADDLYAFFSTCHHLGDWLWNDPSAKVSQGEVRKWVKSERVLRVCADVANGVKHLKLREGSVLAHRLAHVNIAGSVENGQWVDTVAVVFTGDDVEDALPIVHECIAAWDRFLTERGLLPLSMDT